MPAEGDTGRSLATGLRCVFCRTEFPLGPMFEGCPRCATATFASGVTPAYAYDRLDGLRGDGPGIWRYRALLPVLDTAREVSLGEGNTPLVSLPWLAAELDAAEVWVKDESRNPTWSFKDRNAAVTISKAVELGARRVIASTSGNHGVSVAAYAARAGLPCVLLTYPGVPRSALLLMHAYGAQVVVTTPEGRWAVMREAVRDGGWYPAVNFTTIPTNGAYGHEGYKTIAYEIWEELGGNVPDVVVVPSSYSEGLYGIAKGFTELRDLDYSTSLPRMVAVEPRGGALHQAWRQGGEPIARVPAPITVARGIGGTTNSYIGVKALAGTDGVAVQVEDGEIMRAQRDLAGGGVCAEPAGAAAAAGVRRLHRDGSLPTGRRIVLVSTSGCLKNAEALDGALPSPPEVAPTYAAVAEALALPEV